MRDEKRLVHRDGYETKYKLLKTPPQNGLVCGSIRSSVCATCSPKNKIEVSNSFPLSASFCFGKMPACPSPCSHCLPILSSSYCCRSLLHCHPGRQQDQLLSLHGSQACSLSACQLSSIPLSSMNTPTTNKTTKKVHFGGCSWFVGLHEPSRATSLYPSLVAHPTSVSFMQGVGLFEKESLYYACKLSA